MGLGLEVGFGEVRQIADYLIELNNSDLLTRSRNASDFFNLSIYRWVLKRDNLIAQNLLNSHCTLCPLLAGQTQDYLTISQVQRITRLS